MSEYFMWCEPTLGAGQRHSNKLCFVKPLLSWPFPSALSLTFSQFHPLRLCPLFYLIDLCILTYIFIASFLSLFLSGHRFSLRKLIFFFLSYTWSCFTYSSSAC